MSDNLEKAVKNPGKVVSVLNWVIIIAFFYGSLLLRENEPVFGIAVKVISIAAFLALKKYSKKS